MAGVASCAAQDGELRDPVKTPVKTRAPAHQQLQSERWSGAGCAQNQLSTAAVTTLR